MKRLKSFLAMTLACILLVSTVSVSAAVAGVNQTNDSSLDVFEELSYQVIANTITVSGKTPYANTAITFHVQENSTPARDLFYYQTKTDASGYFAIKFTMNPAIYDENGANDATLRVGGKDLNIQRIDDIELYSLAEMEGCMEDFQRITDEESFAGFFESYSEMLGVDGGYTAEEIQILNVYYAANPPEGTEDLTGIIDKIVSLGDKLTRHKAMVEGINAAAIAGDASEIERIIESPNNADLIADYNLDFSTRVIIKEADMWARMLNEDGYATIEDIQTAFIEAREAQLVVDKEFGGPVTNDREKYFLDEWKVSNVANMLTVSGALDELIVVPVNVHVAGFEGGVSTDSSKSIAFFDTKARKLELDADHVNFTARFPLNTSKFNGEVMGLVRISAPNTNVHQFYVTLYSQEEIDAMIEQFKEINDVDGLKAFIEDNKTMLEMTGNFSDEKLAVMYELYDERDYSSIEKGVEVVNAIVSLTEDTAKVQNLLDAINASAKGRWGQVQKVIEITYKDMAEVSTRYADALEICKSASKFNSLRGFYSKLLDQEFTTVQDLLDAVETAHETQLEEEKEAATKPSTGGGGGGGGGISFIGGGSEDADSIIIGEGVAVEENIDIPAEELPVAPFTDLAGFDWAKASIDGLRQLAITKGNGDGTFSPGADMTREEYLSMLLKTFGVEIKPGNVPFADVDKNAWYADVVATAYELGITNGMGDGTFGVGENIIRTDMVVLAARLAQKLDVSIPQKEAAVIFGDYTTIPAYGYEAVVAFQQADFLNGDENGNFNPMNNTTRAEAAVFFWSLYGAI